MTNPTTMKALAERLRGIAVCEPSPEPSGTMREAATALDAATAESDRLRRALERVELLLHRDAAQHEAWLLIHQALKEQTP